MTTAATSAPAAGVPELVVRRLGAIAVAGLLVGGALVLIALLQPGKVDPVVIGVIGAILGVPTTAVGALSAILASTRTTTDAAPPAAAVVVGSSGASGGAGVTLGTTADGTTTITPTARPSTPRKRAAAKRAAPRRRRT